MFLSAGVIRVSPEWRRNSNRTGGGGHRSYRRRQREEHHVFMSWICGLTVWFVIGLSVRLVSLSSRTNDGSSLELEQQQHQPQHQQPLSSYIPSAKEYQKMNVVAQKLEQMLLSASSTYEHPEELLVRLRVTDPATWSAYNPVHQALYWFAVSDDSDRLSLQRYALVVLYWYTTSGGHTWYQCGATMTTTTIPYNTNLFRSRNNPHKSCPSTNAALTSSASECDWFGITCTPERHILRIEWSSNNLSSANPSTTTIGTSTSDWPHEILLLSSLELLWWADNPFLYMTIPTFLYKLSNLQSLNLHRTHLHGTVPETLYQLTNLRALRLYETHLSGTIQTDIGRLRDLEWIWIHNTHLGGSIPTELGSLTNLQGLTLHGNSFSNEPPWNLCDLHHLKTYWTDCTGIQPPSCTCCSKCFVREVSM